MILIGIFKPASHDNSSDYDLYRHEIAAYKIDKLLGLRMVPLTTEREINGEKGSFQLWVNDLKESSIQLSNNARFFDYLIYHGDRDTETSIGANSGYRHDQIVLYDNSCAFLPTTRLPSSDQLPQFIPESGVLEKARKLNINVLNNIRYLTSEEQNCLLYRRDQLIKAIDGFYSASGMGGQGSSRR